MSVKKLPLCGRSRIRLDLRGIRAARAAGPASGGGTEQHDVSQRGPGIGIGDYPCQDCRN